MSTEYRGGPAGQYFGDDEPDWLQHVQEHYQRRQVPPVIFTAPTTTGADARRQLEPDGTYPENPVEARANGRMRETRRQQERDHMKGADALKWIRDHPPWNES